MVDPSTTPREKTSLSTGLRFLWFLVGAIGTYILFWALTGFKYTGAGEKMPPGKPAIHFTFDDAGGALLAELTRKNLPSGQGDNEILVKRHMAIILDGLVLSAPTINSEINKDGQISCEEEDVDRLVNILRAGGMGGLSGVGLLELRILANSVDDKAAIDDMMRLINAATPEIQKALEEAQLQGLPPPILRNQGLAGEPKVYDLVLAKGAKSRVTYGWVELGPAELRNLKLDNKSRNDPKQNETWQEAAKSRGKASTFRAAGGAERKLLQGALFYSRECKDRNLPQKELEEKQFEFFVLARNPEIDVATGKGTPRIDGSHLVSVLRSVDANYSDDPDRKVFTNLMILAMVAFLGGILLLGRLWIRLPWELFFGHCVALAITAIVILAR